ncbi:unnamed protein product [Rhodiola kirilowii]
MNTVELSLKLLQSRDDLYTNLMSIMLSFMEHLMKKFT